MAAKQRGEGGYPSATFAAIWSMFLCILFMIHGAQIVFGSVSSELGVGFMIGVAAMMTQLFFVLMCVFFVLATEAKTAGYGKEEMFFLLVAVFRGFCIVWFFDSRMIEYLTSFV